MHTVTATSAGSITGTTNAITTTAGAPSQYLVTSSNYSPAAGSSVTISAQLADANDNPVTTSGVAVSFSSTNGGTLSPINTTTGVGGIATTSFTTSTTAGTVHTVTATSAGSVTGTTNAITTTVGTLSPANSTATVPAGTAGSATNITVQARDASGNPLSTGGANVVVTVTGSNSAGPFTAADGGDGTYTTSYTPSAAGTDNVAITMNGTALNDSPYTSVVSAGALSPANSTATVPAGTAGSATNITVQARDASGNPLSTGRGQRRGDRDRLQ